jgi:hypothetical protein
MGAEMTALKMVASTAEAERTSPVLLRTNSRLSDRSTVAMNTPPVVHAANWSQRDADHQAG